MLCIFSCWEMILGAQNVVWIFGWVTCLIAFMSVFFSSWKIVFKLLDLSRSSFMHCFSHVLHLSFILSFIASLFITFMHLYGFFVTPWSSLYFSGEALYLFIPFVNRFLFKILCVRGGGREGGGGNTCLCKREMCFTLLGGVLTSIFLYTSLVTMFTYSALIFDIYMMIYVFFTYPYLCSFFSFFIHMFLITYVCNLLFLFHIKMPRWVLFKVLQKYRLSKSTFHKLSSCKVFQEFVLG